MLFSCGYLFFFFILSMQVLYRLIFYFNLELSFSLYTFFGLKLGYAGLLTLRPMINMPSVISFSAGSKATLWPMMFVMIACGAISGFHSFYQVTQPPNRLSVKRTQRKSLLVVC
ncbi:MAG: carbon starvation CstA family protein [bacterium]|nr:carbon starvation CstA family protein [bacterium]